MALSSTETITSSLPSLSFRGEAGPGSAPESSASSAFSKGAVYRQDLDAQSTTSTGPPKVNKGQWNDTLDPALGFDDPNYKYKRFLPVFRNDYKLPPLEPFDHHDPGHEALNDSNPRAFLDGAEVEELTPDFGSDVKGIQLSQLDTKGRQQLALFVAQRGVVAFREQDLIDKDPRWQIDDFTSFYGRAHTHPTSGAPEGIPELHLVYRDGKKHVKPEDIPWLSTSVWHSDVSYELQPPGLTALYLYESPPAGGDTGFADQRGAYNQLSPSFRAYLETLSVVHSAVQQANESRNTVNGDVVKREPVENVHPLVRRHPVTGEKALYVNENFSRSIVGLKKEESDTILKLLYDHVAQGADFQARIRWRPGTVVVWDNRITSHTAIIDFRREGARRHGARLTPQAERPFL